MPRPPKYAFHLSPEGIVRVVKTSGEPITEDEVQFMRYVVRDGLKAAALSKSATHTRHAELEEQQRSGLGVTRGGVRFEVEPVLFELEEIAKRRGLSQAMVAKAAFMQPGRFYDWLRGASRPHMNDLRTWAAVLNRVLVLVPVALLPKVREMIRQWEAENETAEEEAA